MKITLNIRPIRTVAASNKDYLVSKVSNYGIPTISSFGTYLTGYNDKDDKFAIVVNYQLTNRKTKQTKGKNGKTTSVILRKKFWTVRIYQIPIDLLKTAGLRVVQKTRHFEINNLNSLLWHLRHH